MIQYFNDSMFVTQPSTTLTRGPRALRLGAALLLALLPLATASARIHHNDTWARQQFAKAERMREALNGRPVGERTRRECQRVIDSYRRVYFGSPSSSKADPSVVATAELMIEMGRRFDDNKILRRAVDQYRFLRKEYPGSKYRFDALFTIGEIYKDDLNDPEEARTIFEDFLHRYPRNRLADDAHAAMKEIDADADAMERTAQKAARKQRPSSVSGAGSNGTDAAVEFANAVSARRSALPRVTGVRHWSTPDYTRVAIDVEQEVKFGSQRISHPDRIFFDLRDTKLASTLVGKTFDVDDGFLKKIRVAEFQPGRTRIVLEVDDLARYDAFLLPDPYRLIIDIHGKDTHGKDNHGKQSRATGFSTIDTAKADIIKTDTATAKGRSAPDTATTASAESADDSSEPASSNGDSRSEGRKAQQESDKDTIRFSKSGPVETDLPAEDVATDSKPPDSANPANGIGVIKTTVAVKGSNHRIPKTIVEAEDRVPSTVASLKHEKLRPEVPSSSSSSLRRKKFRSAAPDTADLRPETREARPTAAGDRALIRALGLKIGKIGIDARHGGPDTGTMGP